MTESQNSSGGDVFSEQPHAVNSWLDRAPLGLYSARRAAPRIGRIANRHWRRGFDWPRSLGLNHATSGVSSELCRIGNQDFWLQSAIVRDILSELGVEPRGRGLVWLVAVFAAATLAVLTSEEAVIRAIGLPAIVLQFAVWSGWLVWLGYWFPRHRRQTLAKGPGGYRRAFYRDILPGVAVSFSQLSRPAWIGLLDSHLRLRWSDLLGAGLILVGLAVICWACRSIGIARVLFVYEYREGESWLVSRGSYRWIRHPLFVAGVLMSL